MTPLLSVRGLSKSYGGVEALKAVDLDVYPGDVVAVCGDNGAGKSTLIRIVAGAQSRSAGTVTLRGAAVDFRSPDEALAQGIATIYQDLALAPRLSIYENVFMGAELTRPLVGRLMHVLDKRRMMGDARTYLARLGIEIADMRRPVERLSGGQRQAVAIARALRWNAEIVIMDEPTAALGVKEAAQVLSLIRRLREEGRTVLIISHNMADVVAVATRVAIFKSGAKVIDRVAAGLSADQLAHMVMIGRDETEAKVAARG